MSNTTIGTRACRSKPPPFTMERCLRTVLSSLMSAPHWSSSCVVRILSSNVTGGAGQTSKLDAPPLIRQSNPPDCVRVIRSSSRCAPPSPRASGKGWPASVTVTDRSSTPQPSAMRTSPLTFLLPRTFSQPAAIRAAPFPAPTTVVGGCQRSAFPSASCTTTSLPRCVRYISTKRVGSTASRAARKIARDSSRRWRTTASEHRGVLGILFVDVGGAELAIGTFVFDAARCLGFLLMLGLAVDTHARERQRRQTSGADLRLTALADAIGAGLDTFEGLLERLQLVTLAVRQNEIDLAIALFAGEVICIHALFFAAFSALLEIFAHLSQNLAAHRGEFVADGFQKCLAHVFLVLQGRGNVERFGHPVNGIRTEHPFEIVRTCVGNQNPCDGAGFDA